MVTLSPKPDRHQPSTLPFLTGRLGPIITDITREQCSMSLVLLQGGGLSQSQIDQVARHRVPVGSAALRWLAAIWPKRRKCVTVAHDRNILTLSQQGPKNDPAS